MSKIIAFAGKMASGKDTCCKFLTGIAATAYGVIEDFNMVDGDLEIKNIIVNENTVYPQIIKNYKFADELKEFCINVLGLDRKLVYGTQKDKESLTHIKWEDCPGVITNKTLYNCLNDKMNWKGKLDRQYQDPNFRLYFNTPGFMTIREVLQYFGTDMVRKMYHNCWVIATINKIKSENPVFACCSDARFINEFQAVKDNGGIVIKLTRDIYNNKHISEKEIDEYNNWDIVINNDDGDLRKLYQNLTQELKRSKYFVPLI